MSETISDFCEGEAVPPALADLAREINHHHAEAARAAGVAVKHACEAGECLIQAKAMLPHGQWLPWLEANCQVSGRSAQAYMRVARELPKLEGSKAQRVADLPLREAVRLLANESEDRARSEARDHLSALIDGPWEGEPVEVIRVCFERFVRYEAGLDGGLSRTEAELGGGMFAATCCEVMKYDWTDLRAALADYPELLAGVPDKAGRVNAFPFNATQLIVARRAQARRNMRIRHGAHAG